MCFLFLSFFPQKYRQLLFKAEKLTIQLQRLKKYIKIVFISLHL